MRLPWTDTSLKTDPEDHPDRWALRRIVGNITISDTQATAWYLLPPEQWAYRSDPQRMATVMAFATGLLPLLGRRVYLRGTTRPFDHYGWAENLTTLSPDRGPGWDDWLVGEQERIRDHASLEKTVFLGVDLPLWTPGRRMTEWALRRTTDREIDRLIKSEADIGSQLSDRLHVTAATELDLRHLLARSIGVGLPGWVLPQDAPLDVQDLDGVRWTSEPYKRCVQVTATHPGTDRVSTRFVTTLTLGRPPEMTVPDAAQPPWMTLTDRLPFPVEWCSVTDLSSGPVAAGEASRKLKVIRDMQAAYHEHEMDEPLEFERQAKAAKVAEDAMRNESDIIAARAHGWYTLTVWGVSAEQALERARETARLFTDRQWRVGHPYGQYALTRQLVPCEPQRFSGYKRRMPLLMHAAGLPHVAARVGDARGPVLGVTVGAGRQIASVDTHYATEVAETSGVSLIAGANGSGKSALLSMLAVPAVHRGISTTILDPSGPLAGLCGLFPDQSRHLSLNSAPAGTLNPWRLIPQPRRHHFERDGVPTSEVDRRWQDAIAEVHSDRLEAAMDAALGTLPWSLAEDKRTPALLRQSIRETGGAPGGSFRIVIAKLAQMGEHGKQLADELSAASEAPRGGLYLRHLDADELTTAEEDFASLLTVITFPGLQTPAKGTDRKYWRIAERRDTVLMQLALMFTSRAIYTGSMTTRKLVLMDELRLFNGDSASRAFGARIGFDSRKWNAAVPLATQIPKHHMGMGLEALASTVMIGHLEHADAAGDACDLLRIPRGTGYEATFASLNPNATRTRTAAQASYRDWVIRDVFGQVERVRITLPADLHAAIDTTARVGADTLATT